MTELEMRSKLSMIRHLHIDYLGNGLYSVSRQCGLSGHSLRQDVTAVLGDIGRYGIYRVSYGNERLTIKIDA
jgi:hypothetical protein